MYCMQYKLARPYNGPHRVIKLIFNNTYIKGDRPTKSKITVVIVMNHLRIRPDEISNTHTDLPKRHRLVNLGDE